MKTNLILLMVMFAVTAVQAQSTWTVVNSTTTQQLLSVYMPESNKVLAGGKNGILLMSNDYGATMNTISLGSAEDIKAITFFNPLNGRMFLGRDLMKTTDGGYTWMLVSEIPGKPNAAHFLNSDTCYVACDLGEAYSSFDGGLTWNLLTTGVTERLEAVCFKNGADGFWGGRNNTSLRTVNMGQSFSSGVIPANRDIKDILFVTSSSGYSCGTNGEILFTGNGGTDWLAMSTPAADEGLDALHFTDAANGWCSGEAGVILHTANAGATWVRDFSNSLDELNSIHLFDPEHGFAAGDNGTVVRLGSTSTSADEIDPALSAFTVSPNPARVSTNARYSLVEKAEVTIKVANITGSVSRIFSSGLKEAGSHLQVIPCDALPVGLYFCTLLVNGYPVKTTKLLVTR